MSALALAGMCSAGSAVASAVARAPVTAGSHYLALGDSYSFGYEESGVVPAPNYHVPSSFVGYPELLASELHLKVANAACPGETSASLINPAAQSNGCENTPGNGSVGYRRSYPLHVHYRGSQLSFALSYLRTHRDVRLVSLMIGGNDGLLCIETTKDACSSPAEMAAVEKQIRGNVHRILHAIRVKAGYQGELAIVNYPSPLISYNPRVVSLNAAVDAAARPFGVVIADGYGIFQAAEAHSGGTPVPPGC